MAKEVPQHRLYPTRDPTATCALQVVDGVIIGYFHKVRVDDDPDYSAAMAQVAERYGQQSRIDEVGRVIKVAEVGVDPASDQIYLICGVGHDLKSCIRPENFERLDQVAL